VGEKERQPFQFTFNGLLKVAFQGSRVTSDAGLILVRELDERLGLEHLITDHLNDSRNGMNTQFRVADLLRQSVYSRLAGYEDLNDAAWLAADPTFRLIGSPKRWDRSAALTSTLHWFETELLTREENLVGLMALNRDLLAQTELLDHAGRVVLDMDSSESPVHGQQEGSAYNGHFQSVCYSGRFQAGTGHGSGFARWRVGDQRTVIREPLTAGSRECSIRVFGEGKMGNAG
jgi:Transposase DDE domain group 1